MAKYLDYYGCVRCQKQHFEGDDLYTPHLSFQSKHGIQQSTFTCLEEVEIIGMWAKQNAVYTDTVGAQDVRRGG